MTPDLEQLADEAIEWRDTEADRAVERHRIPIAKLADHTDHLATARRLMTETWNAMRPALGRLANDRIAALDRLAEEGITPDNGCTATAGPITLEAVRDIPPVSHRYRIVRMSQAGGPEVGVGWLTTDPAAGDNYVIRLDTVRVYGSTISEALQRAATNIADTERRDRQAVRS